MDITVPFRYQEEWLPPGCRAPRMRTLTSSLLVVVPEVAAAEAPVALASQPHVNLADWIRPLTYRTWRSALYTSDDGDWLTNGVVTLPVIGEHNEDGAPGDVQTEREYIRERYRPFLLVDGVPHRRVAEPRYVIVTFGLGNSRPGSTTALMEERDGSRNDMPRSRYFSVKDVERAVQAAEAVALRRGDTRSLPIEPDVTYTILLPDALTADPQRGEAGDLAVSGTVGTVVGTQAYTPTAVAAG